MIFCCFVAADARSGVKFRVSLMMLPRGLGYVARLAYIFVRARALGDVATAIQYSVVLLQHWVGFSTDDSTPYLLDYSLSDYRLIKSNMV
jgi:hypothetical protein